MKNKRVAVLAALALLVALRSIHVAELHHSADPMGCAYLNVFKPGDALGWHFDNSEFSVSLFT